MTNKFSNDDAKDGRFLLNLLLNFLSLADGYSSVGAIADKLAVSLTDLLPVIDQLKHNGLINLSSEAVI